jgi:hypothetical protein
MTLPDAVASPGPGERGTPDERAPGSPGRSGEGDPSAELSAKAVDAIDLLVATVNDKAVRPLLVGARAVVFGVLIAVMGTVVLIVACVAILRLLDVYVFPGRVWASYATLGLLFVIVGLLAWSRRDAQPADERP